MISFVPVVKDHGETWGEYKSSSGKARRNLRVQLFALWLVPLFTAIGTLITGFESITSGRENAELRSQAAETRLLAANTESNNLILRKNVASLETAVRELAHLYDQSTNALAEANARLISIRPIKERLLTWLYQIAPEVIPELKNGKTRFRLDLPVSEIGTLSSFLREPGWDAYISSAEVSRSFTVGGPLGGGRQEVTIEFKPELAK